MLMIWAGICVIGAVGSAGGGMGGRLSALNKLGVMGADSELIDSGLDWHEWAQDEY